jgi:hypothetical protein
LPLDAASRCLAGLVNDSTRKSIQAVHGRSSDAGSCQALEHFITHSPWAVAPVWARLHALIPEGGGMHLSGPGTALVPTGAWPAGRALRRLAGPAA